MATFITNLGLSSGSHLMEGSTLMPKWEDRSGIPITQTKVNLLPKNVAQDPTTAKGPLFEVQGPSPETYNFPALVYQKVVESEYFKCLYVFKTFDRVVDEVYNKVSYVEPWARGTTKTPSSAYCLLVKLFTLRLTEVQVKTLLDHGDSTHIRALGALYARYALPRLDCWKWLGEYADDLETFAPGLDPNDRLTFGDYCAKLLTQPQYYTTPLPRMPVNDERLVRVQLVLHEERVERGRRQSKYVGTEKLAPGATVSAIYDDADPNAARWLPADVVECVEPYDGAPDGTLPEYVVEFHQTQERLKVKLGMIDLPRKHKNRDRSRRRDRDRDRDRDRSRRRRRNHDEPRLPREDGEPVLGGRDILADVVQKERDSAVAGTKSDVLRKPVGFNIALITSDRESYRKRSRSRSPQRTTVAPLVPDAQKPKRL